MNLVHYEFNSCLSSKYLDYKGFLLLKRSAGDLNDVQTGCFLAAQVVADAARFQCDVQVVVHTTCITCATCVGSGAYLPRVLLIFHAR